MDNAIRVVIADLDSARHQQDIVHMTQTYALDEMGNGGPLSPEVLSRLIPGLRATPTTIVFLAYMNESVVGCATCFRGFSTFAAKPLINIHDLVVSPEFRARGIGRLLLSAVEEEARRQGCVKLTLEVQENNHRARATYHAAGFAHAIYGETTGGSLFYTKRV